MPVSNESGPTRRKVVVGACLGLFATAAAACAGSGKKPADSGASSPPGGPPAALAKTADVPVGSGVIVGDVVLTQATAGDFKGFSAVCPHAGCNVSEVTDGKIVCPCHGSKFNLDGTVDQGPAKSPLEAKPISVQGVSIVSG